MKTMRQSFDPGLLMRGALRRRGGGKRTWLAALIAGVLLWKGGIAVSAVEPVKTGGPVKVQILQTNGGYQLYVDQNPFYIKGAGMESGNQEALMEHGGNSFRTWGTDDKRTPHLLERALTNRLSVTLGLRVGLERQGFDNNDEAAVARQLARVKQEVLKYKDHPAVIIWAIGNELNMNAKNPKVWDAVNDISKMIHQVDPNHLTTTPLSGFKREVVQEVKNRAPDLDLVSFQMYADIVNLPHYLREAGWTEPYMITEWGATGGTCTYKGMTYSGTSSVTIQRTDAATLEVDHTFTDLSNGKVKVSGSAQVTWSATEHSRHVVHQLNWTRLTDNLTAQGSGDRTQTLIDPAQGLLGGVRIDGNRHWSGPSGNWDLAITGVEVRLQDPVPQAGSYSLTTPGNKNLTLSFDRQSDDVIRVTLTGPKASFSFNVRETGSVSDS